MAIEALPFGKNLRPSTVEAMNKINEIITAVNQLDPSNINQIEVDVATLKGQMTTATDNIGTLQTDVTELQSTTTEMQDDVDKIKVTLYTPLASDEREQS